MQGPLLLKNNFFIKLAIFVSVSRESPEGKSPEEPLGKFRGIFGTWVLHAHDKRPKLLKIKLR